MNRNPEKTEMVEVFTPYIRRNGKLVFPKTARFFHFWVTREKHEAYLRRLSAKKAA